MGIYDSVVYKQDLETAIQSTVDIDKLNNCSILVTGATGTIGSFVVDMLIYNNKLHGANITVYAAGRSKDRLKKRFAAIDNEKLIFVEHDITKELCFSFQVDYVIHAGGNAHPAAFNSDPVGTILGNISGTYELLEYARKCGVKRFLYVSSGEVYGQGDLSLNAFPETYSGYVDPTSPRSCYPSSKRTAETLCASYFKQYGLETVIVRPCHTYGPGITESDNRANAQFIRNVLNGENIIMKSAGTQMRSYCYVADCASALLTVMLKGVSGEAYNTANSDSRVTIAQLAATIAGCGGRKVVFEDPTALDISNQSPIAKQVLDTRKLEKLGWHGKFSIEEGISHILKILNQ